MTETERAEWEAGCWCGGKGMPPPEWDWLKRHQTFMQGYESGRMLRTAVLFDAGKEAGRE